MNNIKILVVDDDKGLRDLLQRYLTEQGYEVFTVADAIEMDVFFNAQSVDLLILDLMLPGEDGLSIARRLRSISELPIIILSAKGDEVEKIIGLEMGADDYLAKPFNPRELLARIRAVLRRQYSVENDVAESKTIAKNITDNDIQHEIYQFGSYSLDVNNHRLYCHDQEVSLTAGEFSLLHIFVSHAERVLSRDQLMDLMKGYDRSPFDRSIDIRVTRLRKKIEIEPKKPQYIRTIWGTGYLFSSNNS
ncbi:MAG: response regulator [gamma proteobacterium symbiont of Taylorina sp.]|nr:response regulator [gamma proteobacterium symbiont of Taylorina sp.]